MTRVFKCPHCSQTIGDPPYGKHFDCPHCAETIYFSHCWRCSVPISGTKEDQCPKCGLHYCKNCTSCAPNCEDRKPEPPFSKMSFIFDAEPDEQGDIPDDDDGMTIKDLMDETPDACMDEWRDEDPSAYSGDGPDRD